MFGSDCINAWTNGDGVSVDGWFLSTLDRKLVSSSGLSESKKAHTLAGDIVAAGGPVVRGVARSLVCAAPSSARGLGALGVLSVSSATARWFSVSDSKVVLSLCSLVLGLQPLGTVSTIGVVFFGVTLGAGVRLGESEAVSEFAACCFGVK